MPSEPLICLIALFSDEARLILLKGTVFMPTTVISINDMPSPMPRTNITIITY